MRLAERGSDTIHVVCAADADYVQPMAAMLHSVVANLDPSRTLHVWVLDAGIAEADKQLIAGLCGGSVSWIIVRDSLPGVPLWGRMAVSTYYKLLLPDRLPSSLARVIWLDCDLLVTGDIARLWDLDLGGQHALAVRDAVVPHVSSRAGVSGWRELNLRPEAPYFNAGVMVIDLALWRRDRVGERALEYVRQHREGVYFWDQEGLNAVLAGHWGELDERWNRNVSIPVRRRDGSHANEPWIIHFAGNVKPWRYVVHNTPHDLYFKHLDGTPWKGWRPRWSPFAPFIVLYERLGIRRLLYPLESLWVRVMRAMTMRSADEEA